MKFAIQSLKSYIRNLSPRLYPYEDISEWIDKNSESSKDAKQTLVHVGAHWGQEASAYEKSIYINRVIWVEANPETFLQLQENLGTRKLTWTEHKAFNCLLTSQNNHEYQFHTFSNHGSSSSIFRATNLFKSTWLDVHETGEMQILKSLTLDSLLNQNNISPDLLVIDTQGAELEVLKGSLEALSNIRAVELEVSKQAVYEGGCLYEELDLFLTHHGFKRLSFVPWHGNVLYAKNPRKLELLNVKIVDIYVQLLARMKYLLYKLPVFRN
jgi:FkbM family methyltransferase